MTAFLQSVFAFILGLALCFFGLIHSVARYPGAATFTQLISYLPTIGTTLFFGVGVMAALAGFALLAVSSRHIRQRWRYLRQLNPHRIYHHGEDEHELTGAYR